MPIQIVRNGRTYTEYSPHEIDAIRMNAVIDDRQRRGLGSYLNSEAVAERMPSALQRTDRKKFTPRRYK